MKAKAYLYDVRMRRRNRQLGLFEHTRDCFAQTQSGRLLYTPCRVDGFDRNLREVNPADEAFLMMSGKGLTLRCTVTKGGHDANR
jgi:hypothetical protein